jgi:uncharacterized protein YbjT (DUF2867 family)
MGYKTIAVLGGTGFVGSSIVAKLDAAGYKVKVLTRRREDGKHLILLPNVQVVECHLPNTHALKDTLRGCDAVINLVGSVSTDLGRRCGAMFCECARQHHHLRPHL